MIYISTITTEANRAKGSAKKTILEITKGLIWRIEVEFPAGCCGLVHLQIFDGLYQVFPATPGESLRGEAVTAGYDDLYLKNAAPFDLTIKTWNTDETYRHTIQVRIGLASYEAFMSRYMPSVTWDKFNELLTKVAAEQETLKDEQIEKIQKMIAEE